MKKILFSILITLIFNSVSILAQHEIPENQLKKVRFRALVNDLPLFRVTDLKTNAVFRIYFDESSEKVAENSIPVLAAFYRELAEVTAVNPDEIDWAAIVFTQNSNYIPPRLGNEVRWKVLVENDGKLGNSGLTDLYMTIPHEQVHAIQRTFISDLPRWFSEGQANWAGLKVTARWKPELAKKQRNFLTESRKTSTVPINLLGWGATRIKREAVLRQVTPEVRKRMEENPNYEAPGPFTFTKDDFTSDESNLAARYDAALELFELMENSNRAGILNLFRNVWKLNSPPDTEKLIEMTRQQTKFNIAPKLQ